MGTLTHACYDSSLNHHEYTIGSFKNTINPDKPMMIMNFGDLFQNHVTSNVCSSLAEPIYGVEIASTTLSIYTNYSSNEQPKFILYWQVVEFY